MPRHRVFFIISFAFLTGTLAASFLQLRLWEIVFLVSIGCVIALFSGRPLLILFTFMSLLLGCGHFHWYVNHHSSGMAFLNGHDVAVVGYISEMLELHPEKQNFVVTVDESHGFPKVPHGKIRVTTFPYPRYALGDELRIAGKIEAPHSFENFSYQEYLFRFHVFSVIYRPTIKKIGEHNAFPVIAAITNVRRSLENQINRLFPEPHASWFPSGYPR